MLLAALLGLIFCTAVHGAPEPGRACVCAPEAQRLDLLSLTTGMSLTHPHGVRQTLPCAGIQGLSGRGCKTPILAIAVLLTQRSWTCERTLDGAEAACTPGDPSPECCRAGRHPRGWGSDSARLALFACEQLT